MTSNLFQFFFSNLYSPSDLESKATGTRYFQYIYSYYLFLVCFIFYNIYFSKSSSLSIVILDFLNFISVSPIFPIAYTKLMFPVVSFSRNSLIVIVTSDSDIVKNRKRRGHGVDVAEPFHLIYSENVKYRLFTGNIAR